MHENISSLALIDFIEYKSNSIKVALLKNKMKDYIHI